MEWLKERRAGLLLLVLAIVLGFSIRRSAGDRSVAERLLYDVAEVPLVAVETVTHAASNWIVEIFQRERLHDQIGLLEARVATLQLENQTLEEVRRENERLGQLLDLQERAKLSGRAARVIAADTVRGVRSIVIDVGEASGIAANSPVVGRDGLVGRVLKVGRRTSVVQLLIDGAAAVAAFDERSGVQGVIVGDGNGGFGLEYVPNPEDVKVGDRLLASGLDGVYPKGALLGIVVTANAGQDAFQAITVQPAAAPDRIETVYVVDQTAAIVPEGFLVALSAQTVVGPHL